MEENTITLQELTDLLDKYFYSKEENDEKFNTFLEEYKNIRSSENEVSEFNSSTQVELHNELIQEIKTLQEYSQFGNNLFYFGMVATGLILIYVLFYKFLRYFV